MYIRFNALKIHNVKSWLHADTIHPALTEKSIKRIRALKYTFSPMVQFSDICNAIASPGTIKSMFSYPMLF
jgi:hypothetical protein